MIKTSQRVRENLDSYCEKNDARISVLHIPVQGLHTASETPWQLAEDPGVSPGLLFHKAVEGRNKNTKRRVNGW